MKQAIIPGLPLNQIVQGNCTEILATFPENSVDVIFADPPYNLQLDKELLRPNLTRVDGVSDNWDKFSDFEAYDQFAKHWLRECKRVLKKSGTIWAIGTYHNIHRIGTIMQDLGFWILNDIIWLKTNPMPNFRGMRFTNATETLIWAQKERKAPYTFNHYAMKNLNEDLQMRSDWLIPVCTGKERIKINGNKAHTTQKPEALLYRILMASTSIGNVVLDPFFGTGTTGVVAKRLGRNWIGIEISRKYIEIARSRIESTYQSGDISYLEVKNLRREIRIPFGSLIESGLLKPGDFLIFNGKPEIKARIQADGTLTYNDLVGSIHKIATTIDEKSSNGWLAWFFWDSLTQQYQPIEILREAFRIKERASDEEKHD